MSLSNLSQSAEPRACASSTCEACGAEFACGASLAGCWCAEVKLSEAASAELRARYERCLCRACLAPRAEAGKGNGQGE